MQFSLESVVQKVNRIQPLNPVMLELLAVINNEESQADDLVKIITTDANTSATILKIANSPFYGFSGRISEVRDACVLLGFDQMRNVIYATAVEQATQFGPHPMWREALRRHALATALIANELATLCQHEAAAGELYSLGLLHALGKQIAVTQFPELFSDYMANKESHKSELLQVFREVGSQVAQRWRLPDTIQNCIRQSHSDLPSECEDIRLVQCSHLLSISLGHPPPDEQPAGDPLETLKEYFPDCATEESLDRIRGVLSSSPDLQQPVSK